MMLRKDLPIILLLSVTAFVIAFALGTAVNLSVGPAFGGIVNAFATAFVLAIAMSTNKSWVTPIIVLVIFSGLAVITPTMGPPGIHKIFIGLVTGIIVSLTFIVTIWLFKEERVVVRYFITGAVMSVTMTALILVSMLYLNLRPESAAKLLAALPFLLPLYGVLGGVGFALGGYTYKTRLSKMEYFSSEESSP